MSDTIALSIIHFWAMAIACSFFSFPNTELCKTSNTANHFLSSHVRETEGTKDTAGETCHVSVRNELGASKGLRSLPLFADKLVNKVITACGALLTGEERKNFVCVSIYVYYTV